MEKKQQNEVQKEEKKAENIILELPKCGIVMPISEIDGCPAEHWEDVLEILKEVIADAQFEANLVSDSDEIGVIQKRIVQNIYNNPIVVCDVSGKNPNVMFELGLRLAFDKPTIIIKDDKTPFSFDTSIIEHITYPRDLRFNKMVQFKNDLSKKIKATYEKSKSDPNYSTFLKSFGEFKVAKLHQQEVGTDEFILESITDLKTELRRMRLENNEKNNITSRRRSSIENDPKQQEFVIKNGILDYMKDKNVKSLATLKKNKDQLVSYLVGKEGMPEYFNRPIEVEKLAEKIIDTM